MRLSQKDIDVIQALASCDLNQRMTGQQVRDYDNVSRSTVYQVLGRLQQRGLVDVTGPSQPTPHDIPRLTFALTRAGWHALSQL